MPVSKQEMTVFANECGITTEGLTIKEMERLVSAAKGDVGIEVMLAKSFTALSSEKREEILDSPDWVAEEKIDGVRAKFEFTEKGIKITTRSRSKVTHQFLDKSAHFPKWGKKVVQRELIGYVFDGEIIPLSGKKYLQDLMKVIGSLPSVSIANQKEIPCKFVVFDIIPHVDTVDVPFWCRRSILKVMMRYLPKESDIYLIDQHEDKHAAYATMKKNGCEGVMLKNQYGLYEQGKRSNDVLKWKVVHTIDCFITGYIPATKGKKHEGLVGAMEVSIIKDGKSVVIGAVSPGSDEMRREVTDNWGTLRHDYYDRVVEVRYMGMTPKGKMRHAVIERWRPDKVKEDCTIFDNISIAQ